MSRAPAGTPLSDRRLAARLGVPFAVSFVVMAIVGAAWPAAKYTVKVQAISKGVADTQVGGTAVEVVRSDGLTVTHGALDRNGAYTVSLASGTYAFCVANANLFVPGGSDPFAASRASNPFPSGGNAAAGAAPAGASGGGAGTTPATSASSAASTTTLRPTPSTTAPPSTSGPSSANPYSCIDAAIHSSRVVQIPVQAPGEK
jgi:hypothetical protein